MIHSPLLGRGLVSTLSVVEGLICFMLLSGWAHSEEFSADLVFRSQETQGYGKIAAGDQKIMIKIGDVITIARIDKNVMWLIMPSGKMYAEMPLQLQNIFVGEAKMQGEIDKRYVGKEMVDEQNSDKYRVTYAMDNKVYAAFIWTLPGVDVPVKKAAEDGSWVIKYRRIYVGKQPDELFEIPAEYQKIDTNMQSLAGAGGFFGEKGPEE